MFISKGIGGKGGILRDSLKEEGGTVFWEAVPSMRSRKGEMALREQESSGCCKNYNHKQRSIQLRGGVRKRILTLSCPKEIQDSPELSSTFVDTAVAWA